MYITAFQKWEKYNGAIINYTIECLDNLKITETLT